MNSTINNDFVGWGGSCIELYIVMKIKQLKAIKIPMVLHLCFNFNALKRYKF